MNAPNLLLRSLVCAVVCFGLCASAATPFAEEATKKLNELVQGETSGFAVLVARDGKVELQGGFGLADLEKKTPISVETKFRIGSISKQFTAAAILRLVEEGKLSLDDPISKFFSDFPRGETVKVRQLLTHTSGLHSYTDKPEFLGRVTQPISADELIAWFRDDPPDFAPGEGFHYCNSGYFLLGEIVARLSGKPLGDYLRGTFFTPLEMKDTGIFNNSHPPADMAIGYAFADDKPTPALDWDMSWAGGAGAMYSTVGDLFRWNEALFNGRVLKPESFRAATTPVKLPPGIDGMSYGFGLVMFDAKRLPVVGHGGGLNGWSSQLLRFPEQHCTVVVLANSMPSPPLHAPGPLAEMVATKALADEIAKQPAPVANEAIDPKSFPDFAGRYDYKGGVMTVTVENDGLYAQLTGQPKFQIFPSAPNEFFWKVTNAQVTFVRGEDGVVTAARHTQAGATFLAPRLKDDGLQLTAEQLEPFVGKYQYGPGAVMIISREGTQLHAQLTGQPKFPIFPKTETEFEWRVVAAKIRFVKGDDGKVTKVIHTQNGNTFDAPTVKD